MSTNVIEEHCKRVAPHLIQNLNSTGEAKKKLDELLTPYTTKKNQYFL